MQQKQIDNIVGALTHWIRDQQNAKKKKRATIIPVRCGATRITAIVSADVELHPPSDDRISLPLFAAGVALEQEANYNVRVLFMCETALEDSGDQRAAESYVQEILYCAANRLAEINLISEQML
jgi:hypothetical protein